MNDLLVLLPVELFWLWNHLEDIWGKISVFLKHAAKFPWTSQMSDFPQIWKVTAWNPYTYFTLRSHHAKPHSCSEILQKVNKKEDEYLKGSSWALLEWLPINIWYQYLSCSCWDCWRAFPLWSLLSYSFLLSSPHLLSGLFPFQLQKCLKNGTSFRKCWVTKKKEESMFCFFF